ncbi:MAG: hypothetical protein QM831_33000 [Kofleriaceae bacterium]
MAAHTEHRWAWRALAFVAGGVTYSCTFASGPHGWLVLDAVLLAVFAWLARKDARPLDLIVALVVMVGLFAIVPDRNVISLDETEYLRTLQHGFIVRDGLSPFNLRWLGPVLAGPLDIFPAHGADGLKAINFGAMVLAATELVVLLRAIDVASRWARIAPLFFVGSYLGTYAATNRLVLDPINYALWTCIAIELLAKRRVTVWLLIAACNSEKAIYWIPIIVLVDFVETRRVWPALRSCLPTVIYVGALLLYTRGSSADTGRYLEQLDRMALTWTTPEITDPVTAMTQFQMLWFPFGAMTVYALLGLRDASRRLQVIALLIVPVMAQVMIAHDAERMVAYAFIVYLPLGFRYLSTAANTLWRWCLVALVVGQHFILPACRALAQSPYARAVIRHRYGLGLALTAFELVVTGSIVWLAAFRATAVAASSATAKAGPAASHPRPMRSSR